MLRLISNLLNFIRLSFNLIICGIPGSLLMIWLAHKGKNFDKLEKHQKRFGFKLNRWLQKSGPSFIKLGQVLSTRSDILGEIVSDQLTELQDKLPPFPFDEVKGTIESEFNQSLDSIFAHFDEKPIAAASIAQVHKAVLKNDQVVAVKILRPNIEERFETDLSLLYFFAKISTFISYDARRMKLIEAVKTFEDIVNNELDLRFEAACASRLQEATKGDVHVKIPNIFWSYTSEKVLTMEWIDGIRVDDRQKLQEAGHNLETVARRLSVSFFNQAYRDGFFHADLHPGNIFVTAKGKIALVDFGIMGFLRTKERIFIAHMLYAFLNRDYDTVAKLHFEIGYISPEQSFEKFSLACRSIGEPIIGLPANKMSAAKLLRQLFKISQAFDIKLQTQLILLQKTMVTIEGVGLKIYPDVNMWTLAEPWIRDWAKENFGAKAQFKNIRRKVIKVAKKAPDMLEKTSSIIEKAESILKHLEASELKDSDKKPQKA